MISAAYYTNNLRAGKMTACVAVVCIAMMSFVTPASKYLFSIRIEKIHIYGSFMLLWKSNRQSILLLSLFLSAMNSCIIMIRASIMVKCTFPWSLDQPKFRGIFLAFIASNT